MHYGSGYIHYASKHSSTSFRILILLLLDSLRLAQVFGREFIKTKKTAGTESELWSLQKASPSTQFQLDYSIFTLRPDSMTDAEKYLNLR